MGELSDTGRMLEGDIPALEEVGARVRCYATD